MVEMETGTERAGDELPALAVTLLKGVIYRDGDERLWAALLELQAQVRDYMNVLNLDLVLDEAEGYAFLRSRPDDPEAGSRPLRLIARRPLSFPVSLLLALLRRKLAEFDAGGGDTRLVLTRDEIVELVRVFLPDSSDDTRFIARIETHINKIVELGFLQRLKTAGPGTFEVRRILKAFVDAQWLAEFDDRLAAYRAQWLAETGGPVDGTVAEAGSTRSHTDVQEGDS
ncbi:DUF4194 domain-containing protein [Thioalkalivibrio sp.]|uniref:DUF4194 domain-containing protein n=1 Tax=Thioalkalivibrio sp. TaxID=2093813 RepID=UPI0012D57D86|nr:DUF4194 domain-containing protein [Thioalkalivibrio sp.]TVP81698.1 MAG: DUF4194 domain-containing protein [Thioalkalivibrio sp.]